MIYFDCILHNRSHLRSDPDEHDYYILLEREDIRLEYENYIDGDIRDHVDSDISTGKFYFTCISTEYLDFDYHNKELLEGEGEGGWMRMAD
jgi:hypothetical protein